MILIADFIPPAPEAAARPDIALAQLGQQLLQHAFALEAGCWVAVVEAAVVDGDDLVLGHEHLRVDEALDALLDQAGLVDGLHGGLGDFEHDRPVVARFRVGGGWGGAVGKLDGGEFLGRRRVVVGRVVGEDRCAVEGAVIFGEV